jgi:hypothetical protein
MNGRRQHVLHRRRTITARAAQFQTDALRLKRGQPVHAWREPVEQFGAIGLAALDLDGIVREQQGLQINPARRQPLMRLLVIVHIHGARPAPAVRQSDIAADQIGREFLAADGVRLVLPTVHTRAFGAAWNRNQRQAGTHISGGNRQ